MMSREMPPHDSETRGRGSLRPRAPYNHAAAPAVAAILLVATVAPGLFFGDSAGRILAGVGLLLASYLGTGYLVLRWAFRYLPYPHRLSLCAGVGLALIVPIQFVCALLGSAVLVAVELVMALLGTWGLVLAVTDWFRAPPAQRRVPTVTVIVLAAIVLLFCIPAAREMSVGADGGLIVHYPDMATHAAIVGALSRVPPGTPVLPSLQLHYHYFLCLAAARLVHWTGLTATDALYRVVRPIAILATLLSFAALPSLVVGKRSRPRKPISWVGPVVACGLPSLTLFFWNYKELGRFLLGGSDVGLAIPPYGWGFCGDMLLGVGGLGFCLLVPMLVCLMPGPSSGFRLSQGVLFGILLGSTVGFNGMLFIVGLGALGIVAATLLLRRSAAGPVILAALVAAAWGAVVGWHVVGGTEAGNRLQEWSLNWRGTGLLLLDLGPKLHVKLLLMAVALATVGYTPRIGLILGMMGIAGAMVLGGDIVGGAAGKYLRETLAVGVTLLAIIGAAQLFIDPTRQQVRTGLRRGGWVLVAILGGMLGYTLALRVGMRGRLGILLGMLGAVAAWYLLLSVTGRFPRQSHRLLRRLLPIGKGVAVCILAFGVISNTQFLWYPIEYVAKGAGHTYRRGTYLYRVESGIVTSLRAISRQLPRAAILAGTSPDWFVYSALAERPIITDFVYHGYMGLYDDRVVPVAASIARLFRCPSAVEAQAIAGQYGVSHILLAPGQDFPGNGCDSWLRPYPIAGALRVYEVIRDDDGGTMNNSQVQLQ